MRRLLCKDDASGPGLTQLMEELRSLSSELNALELVPCSTLRVTDGHFAAARAAGTSGRPGAGGPAAGASKRMQSPKQHLKWGNSSLLEHTINIALKTRKQDVFLVLGANYQLIYERIAQSNITILNNENWKKGLGSSIAFATHHILESDTNYNATLFMLADQPFIDEYFLKINLMYLGNIQ